jgi:hypothetical protein
MGKKLDGLTNCPYVISSCDNFVLHFGWGECSTLSLSSSSFSAMDLHHLFQINKINEGLHNSQTHNSVITGLVQTFISRLKKHVELLLEIASNPFWVSG